MKNVILLVAATLLTSCSTLDTLQMLSSSGRSSSNQAASEKEAPAPSAAETAAIDAAAKADWEKYANATNSGKSFAAGADLSSGKMGNLKINGGEWAVYRTTENGKVKAVIKLALVRKEADAWVFEMTSYTDKETVVIQEAIKGLEAMAQSGNPDQGQILWVKIRDKKGRIDTLDGVVLGIAGNSYKTMFTSNTTRPMSAVVPGGPLSVAAGTFAATWKTTSTVAQGRGSETGTVWISTQVPIWHMIKAQTSNGSIMELVAFGTSGYQSAFP